MLEKKELFGIGITNASEDGILEYVIQSVKKSSEKYFIVTPNPEIIVFAKKDKHFHNILNQARIALCDGIGLYWASRILGKGIKERVTGVDFMEKLCKLAAEKTATIGFLGGRDGVAEVAAERLQKIYTGIRGGR